MVAAWISADTGVGPAIASGSHTCSGICADLPQAPRRSSSAIVVVSAADGAFPAGGFAKNALIAGKSSEPTTV